MNEKPDAESREDGSRNVSIWLSKEVLDAIESKRSDLDRSRSWMTEVALRAFLSLPPRSKKS